MCVSCKEVSGFCFTERLFIFLSNSERKQVGRGHYNNKSFFFRCELHPTLCITIFITMYNYSIVIVYISNNKLRTNFITKCYPIPKILNIFFHNYII